jgi:hypothetical protein
MLLVYYRHYTTYTLAGFLFDLDQSNVCRDIQKIEQLVRKCLPIPQKTYGLTKRLKTLQEVEKYFPGLMAFVDCTEQQIPRSADKNRRKMYYSGKKKRYTMYRTSLWLTIVVIPFTKYTIKKEENMITIFRRGITLSLPKKLLM